MDRKERIDVEVCRSLMPMPQMNFRRFDAAVHVICGVAFDLDLHGRVIDAVQSPQLGGDGFNHLLARAHGLFLDHHVQARGDDSRTDGPDVQVVNTNHTFDG